MSPEAQRIAIAKACGWKWLRTVTNQQGESWDAYQRGDEIGSVFTGTLPNYPADLNAMHEAEKAVILISDELTVKYFNALSCFAGPNSRSIQDSAKIFCATAAQRAEAFLKCLGLWMEEGLKSEETPP